MASKIISFILFVMRNFVLFQFFHDVILKQTWRQLENDITIIYFFLCLVISFQFCLQHTGTFLLCLLCKICRLYCIYGPVRLCMYATFVCLFSYVFVGILDGSIMYTWNFAKAELIHRLQENIIHVEDSRQMFENVSVHPLTEGKTPPILLYNVYRYREEDVELTCERNIIWLPGGRPYVQQVVWRKNGKPLPWSARYRQKLEFREQNNDESTLTQIAAMHGLSVYTITATLKIYLVKSYDFGNYTCHVAEMASHSWEEWITILKNMENKRKAQNDFIASPLLKHQEQHTEHVQINTVAVKTSIEDMYTASHEFRLIEIPPRQEITHAPPGAVLVFKTSYWHLSESNEDVSAEYFINEESTAIKGCQGQFKGCSIFLLLYWFYNLEYSLFPPFVQTYYLIAFPDRAKIPEHFHCLCENSYGHHHVYFLRRFYNPFKEKYELIEIRHPNDLVVLPREQDMLYLFQNSTSREKQQQFNCPAAVDMHYVEMAAEAFASKFGLVEYSIGGFGVLVCLLILWICFRWVRVVGKFGGRLILDSPDHFMLDPNHSHVDNHEDDAQKTFAQKHFDFFVSYSDTDSELAVSQILPVLESLGLKVCVPDRDTPPNLPILSSVSTAIDNSDRFIIIFSSEYLKEPFKMKTEVDMIGNKASHSNLPSQTSLLVIKVDDCQLLPWMMSFEVHDWTTYLPREDQLRRFSRWVKLCFNRNAKYECYSISVRLLPFLLLFFAYLIVSRLLQYTNVSLLDVMHTAASLHELPTN